MALVVRVEIIDDNTREVKQAFIETCAGLDSLDASIGIRSLLDLAFKIEYGQDNDELA